MIPCRMIPALTLWGVLTLGALPKNADAAVMIQPADATSQMGTFPSYSPDSVIDQSGLAVNYVSGVTDFDAYIASNPAHNSNINAFDWFSPDGTPTGDFDFDLGGNYRIESFALWNHGGNTDYNVIGFTLLAADNAAFTGATTLGGFTADPNTGPLGAVLPQVFTFAPTAASHVRMRITSNNGNTVTGFGEAAFEGTAIPEPSSFALVGLCIGGAGIVAYRRRKASPIA